MSVNQQDPGPQPGPVLREGTLRRPELATSTMRTKRAFLLILITLVLPGSAQLVAGDRRLGRRALAVTLSVWGLVLVGLIVFLVNRSAIFSLLTHPVLSLIVVVVLIALAVGWAVIFLNTLRLIQVPLLAQGIRPVVVIALVASMVLSSGGLAYAAYLIGVSRGAIESIFNGPAIEPVDGRYNFLLIGGDAGDDRVGRRPDSLSVLSVDAGTGQTTLISVPRNLQNAQFAEGSPLRALYPNGYDCGDECLINAINTDVNDNHSDLYPDSKEPGLQATMEAVSGTLGITVQAYVLVDMEGFEQLVDALGGIRVDAGGWVPISGESLDELGTHAPPKGWIAPGEQTLDGFHALWYGRSREFASDYARISRQQCIQQAMINQLNPATVLGKFESIAAAGTQVVESSISATQLGSFADLALKGKGQPVSRLVIGPPDFAEDFPTYPDFEAIHAKVRQVLSNPAAQTSAPAAQSLGTTAGTTSGGTASLGLHGLLPFGEYDEIGPDGVPVTPEHLDELFVTGQNDTLNAIMADNGQCTPL